MGGYHLSYESFETFVQNQARLAKREAEQGRELKITVDAHNAVTPKRDAFRAGGYCGSAEAREDVVFELAKYINVSEKEVKRIWMEAEK